MRKIRIPAVGAAMVFLILTMAVTITAQDAGHGRDIETIVAEIQQMQGVDTFTAIDPDSVPPALLEELGDAVMDRMIGDEERHAWMDQMMGGDGSQQLAAAHRWMGYRYLRSGGGELDAWGPGWMGPAMMGPGMMGRGGMHGWYGSEAGWSGDGSYRSRGLAGRWFHPWYWMLGPIVLIVLIVLIVAFAVVLVRRRQGGVLPDARSTSAYEILRARYARGEITRDELREMTRVLRDSEST